MKLAVHPYGATSQVPACTPGTVGPVPGQLLKTTSSIASARRPAAWTRFLSDGVNQRGARSRGLHGLTDGGAPPVACPGCETIDGTLGSATPNGSRSSAALAHAAKAPNSTNPAITPARTL